jgi:glycosyltransferase involved in cell wall biosynthesis
MVVERRLLVVTESLGFGGTETHLIRLLAPLAACGWSIAVFCLSDRGQRADQLEAAGVSVFSRTRQRPAQAYKNRNSVTIALAANHLFWLMRRWRPHIVHFYLPGPYLVGAPPAIAAGTPIRIMSRRSLSNYQKNHPLLARLERRLHRGMDALIGNSQAVVSDLISEGAPSDKVHLIYNGIGSSLDLPDRSEARQALGIGQDTVVGVVIANLIPYKGHRDLVEGLALVSRSLPPGWRVLCVGRDEGMQEKLEKLAEARGIKGNIPFLGERADTSTLFAAADFCVLSSWEEGFSNVILEAMSAGLPTIVTRVGGNPEAVIDQETGFVVPPRDPEALGNAIHRLAQDFDLRQRLGAAAQRRVRQEFSIESCVDSHNLLYEELMRRRLIGSQTR